MKRVVSLLAVLVAVTASAQTRWATKPPANVIIEFRDTLVKTPSRAASSLYFTAADYNQPYNRGYQQIRTELKIDVQDVAGNATSVFFSPAFSVGAELPAKRRVVK